MNPSRRERVRKTLVCIRWCLAAVFGSLAFKSLLPVFRQNEAGLGSESLIGIAVITGLISSVLCICLIGPELAVLISRTPANFFGDIFYPREQFREPPDSLLKAIRLRILDRNYLSCEQQLNRLLEAYGPHPVVYYLMACNLAAQGKSFSIVQFEAREKLRRHRYRVFEQLMRENPPRNHGDSSNDEPDV